MRAVQNETIVSCLRLVLTPIMRFCVRRQIKVQSIVESVKVVLLDVAAEEIEHRNEEVNVSRLSALTGLHRRDVQRIYREGVTKDYSFHLINRVIGQWQQDPRFLTKSRKARVLSVDGPDSDFRQLMNSVATDLKPGTVLFELERIGAVERVKNGIKLTAKTYEPKNNPEDSFDLLADDTEDILRAVEENVFEYDDEPHLHAKTVYDNITVEALPKIHDWLLKEGASFHRKARNFLSKYDIDIHPNLAKDGGTRVAIGTFSRVTYPEEEGSN